MALEGEAHEEEQQEEREILLPNCTIATHCVLKNDVTRFTLCFENDEDPYKETVGELINQRDDDGKSPLDIAATLGRLQMIKELIARGADVNSVTEKGFCALHYAASWGHVEVLKVLIGHNANLQQRNVHNERPRETALRYNQTECVDFLDWAEAKVALQETIRTTIETLQDPEKVQGRFTKEDKSILQNTCKEKNEWMENTPDATTQDFITQKATLEEVIGPILLKLTEPRDEPPPKGQKKSK
ncbi:hypothetical protein CHS0354_013580 [Potamilus streckersoni]|uniref:Ankyrin repeat domain-containing protein 45 n=1 Tax=Potamilus streckersoni TaxID=2493646 RepID=A0AAE0VWZ3_9BIVA|nr:hypothetical protein CHS0354_013580 [Potamilus streckersoni]